ncbi:disease resistance protein RUN1-like [Lotus japonicus]|uniref:disease resistance protein RUN1-like n=1 Tax=Lotus japonicus TaxID=34305 RepID=UPI00258698D9|nr:disease resistance protein RUN1-like [Lotus japonicus]
MHYFYFILCQKKPSRRDQVLFLLLPLLFHCFCLFKFLSSFLLHAYMALQPLSSSSTRPSGFKYDVLLICGVGGTEDEEDVRELTDLLYGYLGPAELRTFRFTFTDHEAILEELIQISRMAIVVISNNFASSSYCLDNLSNILDYFDANGRLRQLLPVFHHVDPDDVAKGVHLKSFKDDHVDRLQLQKWTLALQQLANLPDHFHFGLEDEYYGGEIFEKALAKVISDDFKPLRVQDNLVGMVSRVAKVIKLLDLQSGGGVHMVGITGIVGIGKTTLAREVLNLIADQFEVVCFLRNVSNDINLCRISRRHDHYDRFLYFIPGKDEECVRFIYFFEAIKDICSRLCEKKVLLIVDDVDKLKQLQTLANITDWFSPGSRIITTSRDKHLLVSHGIERIYEVSDLNDEEALDLLTWTVFKDKIAPSECKEGLNYAVTLASGLPLSLIELGSHLCELSMLEWKYYLRSWKESPDETIQAVLELSLDGLVAMEKNIFLDIACCFKGYPLVEVQHILRAHYRECVTDYISALVSKFLINISSSGELTLHEWMRNMGKEIVRRKSSRMPCVSSRLWILEDIRQVLEDCTGTHKIRTICLDLSSTEEGTISWDGKGFKNMENLKTLIIKNVHFSEAPKYLPSSLRVLDWQSYPSQYLPPNFYPGNLSICKLPKCCFVSSEICGLLNKKPVNLDNLSFDNGEHSSNEMVYVSCLPNSREMTVMVSE